MAAAEAGTSCVPHALQHRLHGVCQDANGCIAQEASVPLEGMNEPQTAVDPFLAVRGLIGFFQREQNLFENRQVFSRLGHELVGTSFHHDLTSRAGLRRTPNASASPVTRSTVAISRETPVNSGTGRSYLARCGGTAARSARPWTSRSLVAWRSNRILGHPESIAASNCLRISSAAAESRISGNEIVDVTRRR